MPSTTLPPIPHLTPPPPTTHELDWADLAIVDFSQVHTPEGRANLTTQVRDALRTTGFFYIINHRYKPEQTARIYDIANVPFEHVGPEEKQTYVAQMKQSGSYQGYKPRSYWHVDNGVHDQIEHYNVNHDVNKRGHPEPLRPFLPEISAFAKHNHFNILHRILQLLARGLELPENTFADMHDFDKGGETYVRFMKYYPRSEEDETKTKNVWLKGHTDFGSITVVWSQPISALQILSPDGKWRWIKHIDNALIINAGDCLEYLSGGYYKATIHRVVQPPPDQRQYDRLGAFYFAIPDDHIKLHPLMDSPILQHLPDTDLNRFGRENIDSPTVEIYRKGRTRAYGQSELKKGEKEGVEEEIIEGIVIKHYN